jgi:Resolvase, N terminal domain
MKVAVVYAAKSTEDKHGSIPTQLENCRRRAEREGWQVVAEFSDEAFSAYGGNPSPRLERTKALAAETAAKSGRCIVIAQDADLPSHVPVARIPGGRARRPMGLREVDLRRTQRADGPLGRDAEQLALEAAREEGEADRAYVPRPVGGG